MYAFLAEYRGQLFPDGLFADLFPSGKGRPSVPGEVIAVGAGVAGVAGSV
jgi:hypothetical protein